MNLLKRVEGKEKNHLTENGKNMDRGERKLRKDSGVDRGVE